MLRLVTLCIEPFLDFIEVPMSQEVSMGTEAVFRCRHPTADDIKWKVDESFVGRNSPPDITPGDITEDGNLVDTLTIVAKLDYNTTVVVCMAEFYDETPNERSEPPAMLLIQGEFHVYYCIMKGNTARMSSGPVDTDIENIDIKSV